MAFQIFLFILLLLWGTYWRYFSTERDKELRSQQMLTGIINAINTSDVLDNNKALIIKENLLTIITHGLS